MASMLQKFFKILASKLINIILFISISIIKPKGLYKKKFFTLFSWKLQIKEKEKIFNSFLICSLLLRIIKCNLSILMGDNKEENKPD